MILFGNRGQNLPLGYYLSTKMWTVHVLNPCLLIGQFLIDNAGRHTAKAKLAT